MATRVSVVPPLQVYTGSDQRRPSSTNSLSTDQPKSTDKKLLVTLSSLSSKKQQTPHSGSNQASEVPQSAKSSERKFTDGKGFLHYAVSSGEQEEDRQMSQEDTISCASSFKMDSDVLSLENAEFSLQSYNNNYLSQQQNDEQYYNVNNAL